MNADAMLNVLFGIGGIFAFVFVICIIGLHDFQSDKGPGRNPVAVSAVIAGIAAFAFIGYAIMGASFFLIVGLLLFAGLSWLLSKKDSA